MGKIILLILINILLILHADAKSQSLGQDKDSFFSHLYFPVDFGIIAPLKQVNLSKSFYSSWGVEYRRDQSKSWFVRASWDTYSSKYSVPSNAITNTTKSKLSYDSFLLGIGNRWKFNDKWKFYAFVQSGPNVRYYPLVNIIANGYEVKEAKSISVAMKAAIGLEFYPISCNQGFAITLEPTYLLLPSTNIFWTNPNHQIGVKIGINAVMF